MDDRLTVAKLLEELGYQTKAGDLDESLRWALIELKLRRARTAHIDPILDLIDEMPVLPNYLSPLEPFPRPPFVIT